MKGILLPKFMEPKSKNIDNMKIPHAMRKRKRFKRQSCCRMTMVDREKQDTPAGGPLPYDNGRQGKAGYASWGIAV